MTKKCDWCGTEIKEPALTIEGPKESEFRQELCERCCKRVFRLAMDEFTAQIKDLAQWAKELRDKRL